MPLGRILRHLFIAPWQVRLYFPATSLVAIDAEIARCEATHQGEIRFAVEAALDLGALLAGQSARERAIEVFSQLRVWDTERNNGVLIYILLADHDVEILADRGTYGKVGVAEWEGICRNMEQAFRDRRFEEGVIAGIRAVSAQLARHFPKEGPGQNELPNAPVVL